MTLGFLVGSKNFCKLFYVSWDVFCLTRVWLYPLSCQVLYHYSVSMLVSRFTHFIKNFVICCYQITKIPRSWHDCTSSFSARSSCNFGFQADVAISVLREVTFKYCACRIPLFLAALKMIHEKNSRVRPHELEPLSSTRFSVNSCNHSGRWRNGSHRNLSMPLVLSLLVHVGCCAGITASCGKDVGDVGVAEIEEPVKRPGTTIGT